MFRKDTQLNMTEGVIWRQILTFAIPLILGELFQTLYNTADSLLVGNLISKQALAAVGSTANIVTMVVGFFAGFSTGTTVVIARYFGAGDNQKISAAVHTALMFTVLAGVVFTVIGIAGTPAFLRLLKTPEDVYPEAKTYLRIYFAGMMGLVLYNVSSAILRAVGDSKTPVRILMITSVLNVVLDAALIQIFHMGIAGAALATIFAELVSAVFLILKLLRTESVYRLVPKKLKIDPGMLKDIINIGLPQAIQKIVINFSNVVVLSYVNRFGSDAMTGWSIHQRLDMIINRTVQSLESATTTFVSQNVGAQKKERIRKGIRTSLLLALAITAAYAVLFVSGRRVIIRMFSRDAGVMEYGCIIITMLVPAYVFHAYNHIQAGALRGYGESKAPTIMMILSTVVFRQLYLQFGWAQHQSFRFALSCYIFSWIVGLVMFSTYTAYRRKKRGW